jgi:putative phosphoesterase
MKKHVICRKKHRIMKKIGLLSDTHSFLDEKIFHYFENVDEIWHAGDIGSEAVADALEAFKPFRAVYGNIDDFKLRQRYPQDLRFVVEGLPVWMTHIGGYPGRYEKRVRLGLETEAPGLFISGHSHILKIMPDKKFGLMHINPGACGNTGWHKVKTLVRFGIEMGHLKEMEVIEIGLKTGDFARE